MIDRKEKMIDAWKDYEPEENDDLLTNNKRFMDYLDNGGFYTAPASTKYHGAYEGGLFDHSYRMFERLAQLTAFNGLKWERDESPFIIGMFHDLCKCDQYKITADSYDRVELEDGAFMITPSLNPKYEYNTDTILKGHGSKSVMILSQFINLTEEELFCIRFHMGAYEKDEWPEFDKAIRKYPNVLWTHMADMLASKVDDI